MCHFLHVGYITPKHIQIPKYQSTSKNNAIKTLEMKNETDDLETAVMSSLPFLNQIPIVYGSITGVHHNQTLY